MRKETANEANCVPVVQFDLFYKLTKKVLDSSLGIAGNGLSVTG